jgi:hypothetical protein
VKRVDPLPGLTYDPTVTTLWTPMLWPEAWTEPSMLDFLRDTSFDCLVTDRRDLPPEVEREARRRNFETAAIGTPPSEVKILKGEWPGVKLTGSGAPDRVSAGPTGEPWVDSNGWRIRLAAALQPGTSAWVSVAPTIAQPRTESYVLAIADAAAHGGRWIVSLDAALAAGLADRRRDAIASWQRIAAASAFFKSRTEWRDYTPAAVLGIISNFSAGNEFLSHELLNLVTRTNQQYRIIPRETVSGNSLSGLKSVLYADDEPPSPQMKNTAQSFVREGGLLITGKQWGLPPGAGPGNQDHPRYVQHTLGRGRIAVVRDGFDDPYVVANDSVVLTSHRHELLRFWNGGAVGSFFTIAPERKSAVVHLLFYADLRYGNTTVRIAGRYRSAWLWTPDAKQPATVALEAQAGAVEAHLPPVSGYSALELQM